MTTAFSARLDVRFIEIIILVFTFLICDALDYLLPFLQFIKHEETPIGSVSKVAGFSKQLKRIETCNLSVCRVSFLDVSEKNPAVLS